MKNEDADLVDRGDEVVKAMEHLEEETGVLSDINDEPHLRQEEVEGVLAAIVRVIVSVFKL